jgi:hypothetical protein
MELWPQVTTQRNDDSVTATAEVIKATNGILVGGEVYNGDASAMAYLVFFDLAAASVVLGTTVPVYTVAVPPGQARTFIPPRPLRFHAAMSYAAVTTRLGSSAPATALTACLHYL